MRRVRLGAADRVDRGQSHRIRRNRSPIPTETDHLSGHTVEGGFVKTAPVRLRKRVTIGLGSVKGATLPMTPSKVVIRGLAGLGQRDEGVAAKTEPAEPASDD